MRASWCSWRTPQMFGAQEREHGGSECERRDVRSEHHRCSELRMRAWCSERTPQMSGVQNASMAMPGTDRPGARSPQTDFNPTYA